jgi:hypothetical protein
MLYATLTPRRHAMLPHLLMVSVFALVALILTGQRASAQETAPCYAQFQGRLMFMFHGTLVSCARTIQAAKSGDTGYGRWGSAQVQVDASSMVYVNGQPAGVARNMNGTTGSLSDRCFRGDIQACHQWGHQSEEASRRLQRMYPPGWAR